MPDDNLSVAVTGPTGTFGFGLMPLLQEDDRIAEIVGIARRPFDPDEHGWSKMKYRRGDVRDPAALEESFAGADVVVHLAFLIVGGSPEQTRSINVEGTLNTFRAAAAAGVRRFVYASSVAAYGFHADNPVGMKETWPTRPADRLFYAQEKAELERLLHDEAAKHPDVQLYLLRPPIVLGPHFVGGKVDTRGMVVPAVTAAFDGIRALARSVPIPVLAPDLPVQFIHEDDVGRALLQCVVAAGPPGAYNIAADDVLTVADVVDELGFKPVPVPAAPTRLAARAIAKVPFLPSFLQWVEAASQPAIMDTTRAKTELGWVPRVSAREAIRDTLP